MSKHDKALRLDRRVTPNYADGDLPSADFVTDNPVGPAPPSIPAPTNLQLVAYLTRSAQAGMAMIVATWDLLLNGVEADSFNVQVSTDPSFIDGATQTFVALTESASLENLRVSTLYYVRVQAVFRSLYGSWSDSSSITTPTDVTPPAAVTAIAWQWLANGDLPISWTPPASENYKDAEVRIYTSSAKTLLLRTLYGRAAVEYSAAMNWQDTGNAPVTSVYLEIFSRSYTNVYGPVAVPASQPFKSRPANVSGLTSSWSGDAGLAGASCSISWTLGLDAIYWRLSVDGASYQTATANFEYGLDRNRSDHASIPDPSLSLSVVAVDGLGQTSLVATTAVATNAKPPTTSVVLSPGFNTIIPVIAASAAADFKTYLLRIVKDGTTVKTDRTLEVAQLYDVSPFGSGSYQVGVVVIDAFEQASTETLSSAAIIEPLTLTDLRIDASYEDDLGTSTTALDALKDANNTSGGPNYI